MGKDTNWELVILDADLPVRELDSLAAGDLDGDGNVELVTGGGGTVFWYRPATFERGVVAQVMPHVGVALDDVDGDGLPEVVLSHTVEAERDNSWVTSWFDPGTDLHRPWTEHVIDPLPVDGAHDLVFADLDGDGEKELIANSMYPARPGLFVYKRGADAGQPWQKQTVQESVRGEGTAAADLDGDGWAEIVSGPYLYTCPPEGPFAGPWQRSRLAAGFREMCRVVLVDVTGNGRLDVVVVESEYPDGRLSWFENRVLEDPGDPWPEHPLAGLFYYAHSLHARRGARSGEVRLFLAEMAKGGWDAAYNWDARLVEFVTNDGGGTWRQELVYYGEGTHEATMVDVDGDGELEIVGKRNQVPIVQVWKRRARASPAPRFRHRMLDSEKLHISTDVVAADVDGDGLRDVLCGAWWYRNPTWERRDVPGVYQVHAAFDLDGDGREELVATTKSPAATNDYEGLTSDLVWLKPVDPIGDVWEEHVIGRGSGDWPHGTLVAPLLPGGAPALLVGYHSAGNGDWPELFEVPDDPQQSPWPRRVLAEIPYGEELVAHDLTGNGLLDVAAGSYWLENLGDGTFRPYQVVCRDDFDDVARVRVADVNGNGRPDLVVVQEDVEWGDVRRANMAPVAWLENPGDPRQVPWRVHVIDRVRCPHSLDVADLDGDGDLEIVVGEHDPFNPYRSRCRLYVYGKAEPQGRAWRRRTVDDRFEHHDGARVFEVAPGRLAITSHGWRDTFYVHLWEVV